MAVRMLMTNIAVTSSIRVIPRCLCMILPRSPQLAPGLASDGTGTLIYAGVLARRLVSGRAVAIGTSVHQYVYGAIAHNAGLCRQAIVHLQAADRLPDRRAVRQ